MTIAVNRLDDVHALADVYKWEGLSQTDGDGAFLPLNRGEVEKTVMAFGDIGGGTLVMQMSPTGLVSEVITMDDGFGVAVSTTSLPYGKPLGPATLFLRPRLTGATGGDVDVYLVVMRKR